jgi:hypothetical protein
MNLKEVVNVISTRQGFVHKKRYFYGLPTQEHMDHLFFFFLGCFWGPPAGRLFLAKSSLWAAK